MEKLLDVRGLNVTYRSSKKQVFAVRDVDFSIYQSDSLGIVGESGSGKSTLAMALLRLLPGSALVEGEAEFLSHNLISADDKTLRNLRWKNIAVVLQKAMNAFSPVHRIGEQIEDIYKIHVPKASGSEVYDRITKLFKLVNLSDRVYKLYPHELSGGMMQRVSIAVSLLHNPELLIFDEATTALDVITQGQILKEIVSMEKELNMTRIMITHDISVVASSCNKIAVMYAGEFMEMGLTKDVLKNPMHPYTKGLLASFPSLKGEKKALKPIGGFLPDLSVKHDGCVFAPRCEYAKDSCHSQKPEKTITSDGRFLYCVRGEAAYE